MNKKIKILLLEDLKSDAELIEMKLKATNMQYENLLVDTREEFIAGLKNFTPDIVLADHSVSAFNSMEALKIVMESDKKIPFILVSAMLSQEYVNEIISAGASGHVLKDHLEMLPEAIVNSLVKNNIETERLKLSNESSWDNVLPKALNNPAQEMPSLNESIYDLSILEEMDDNDYLIEIISMFLNECPREFNEMRKAYTGNNPDGVCRQAHKLKSSTGLIQANTLSDILVQIEEITKQGKINDSLLKLIQNAQEEYRKIETSLKKRLIEIQLQA